MKHGKRPTRAQKIKLKEALTEMAEGTTTKRGELESMLELIKTKIEKGC